MKSSTTLKRGLAKVRREWLEQRFDRALEEVNRLLESRPDNPKLLVMRANLIPLQESEDSSPTLADAKGDLKLAVELDDQAPAALIDLGYFLFAFEDDAAGATKSFQKAIKLCRELLKDALLGQAEALAELDHEDEALACLMEAYSLVSHNGRTARADVLERFKAVHRTN